MYHYLHSLASTHTRQINITGRCGSDDRINVSVPVGIEVQSEGACVVLSGSADSVTYRSILLSARQAIEIVHKPSPPPLLCAC